MNDFLLDLMEEYKRNEKELRYLIDFIHYENLDEEFLYFKKYAHEDTEADLPFPNLVL